ncbi:transcriptional regulator, DeoR family [Chitinophaga jiangningensis]|uniref:Transcriptional regulator, DeoR family n=1 Tax=Chitinophaga jiangningensis TaxID=1419482 RepID=A0A1M6WM53_9BACT|nr:DeoR/GlpR family DNA-binding transcription regulator [Chitinophaga jiangningensis]SHK94842.1 transcriptional regulator, DeoR family [Chitinophaga jiangningensis]
MHFFAEFDGRFVSMLKEERQAYILHQVNLHNKVLSSHLSEQLQVSEDTIRRDLTELAREGKILKVHGGALSKSYRDGIASHDVYAAAEKRIIAMKAVQLIQDGMFVLTTGGTTIMEMARLLPEDLRATFITVSLPAAFEYANHPNIEVIVIGDKLAKDSKITVGGEAITKIMNIRADLCFLGVNAIDADAGLTDNDWEVVQVKKAMIATSRKVVALSISEKVDTADRLKVCDIDAIDIIITELQPKAKKLIPYGKKGVKIL